MKGYFVFATVLGLFLTSSNCAASCMRIVPIHRSHPDLDGPGSFSPLQDTLTLDCLVFKGVVVDRKMPYALLEDERGQVYRITVGNYVGENSGKVVEITKARVKIVQLIRDDKGGWVKVLRYLFPNQDNRT